MEIIDKTIKSKYQPKQTNVTWIDLSGEKPVEKHFINGGWVAISGGNKESDSEIFDEYVNVTDQQRNTALANVSNQTANSTTGKIGYKVLEPTKTFSEQVTAENTIYEIRDVFDLGGTQETPVSVTLPAGSTLKFNGGIIKNCSIDFNYARIEAPSVQCFDNVTIADKVSSALDVKAIWFGFSGDNTTTNSAILSNLLDKCTNVSIDIAGTYTMQDAITISGTSKLKQFRGIANYMNLSANDSNGIVNLPFPGNGFIISRRCIIDGIKITGNKGTWDSENTKYIDGYTGFDIRTGCEITHCQSQGFMIGMDMSKSIIVHAHIADCLFDYNGNYGVYINEQTNKISVNDIVLERCYFVNIGHNYSQYQAESTKTSSGIGLYIKGGAGNTFRDNVFEYNTGIGLFVDKPESYSIIEGCVILGNYFEHNKYAQLLIDANHTSYNYMSNVVCEGNLFSDANIALPSDALPWREVVLYNKQNRGETSLKLQYNSKNTLDSKSGFFGKSIIPYNAIQEGYSDYQEKAIILAKDKTALQLSIPINVTDRGLYELYLTSKNITNVLNHVIAITYTVNGTSITKALNVQNIQTSFVNTYVDKFMLPNNSNVTITALYLGSGSTEGAKTLIQDIYLRKTYSSSYAELPTTNLYPGLTLYDTTHNKEIVYNGTDWVNLDGTALS